MCRIIDIWNPPALWRVSSFVTLPIQTSEERTLSRSCTCTVANVSTSVSERWIISAENMTTPITQLSIQKINENYMKLLLIFSNNQSMWEILATPQQHRKNWKAGNDEKNMLETSSTPCWKYVVYHFWAGHEQQPSGLNFQSCQLQIFPRLMLGPGANEVHQVRLAACAWRVQQSCMKTRWTS